MMVSGEVILIPSLTGVHWVLACVIVSEKKVLFLDSKVDSSTGKTDRIDEIRETITDSIIVK